jgi:hypothetical protein
MVERIQQTSVIVVVPAETAAGVGSEPVEVEVEVVAHWALEKLLA